MNKKEEEKERKYKKFVTFPILIILCLTGTIFNINIGNDYAKTIGYFAGTDKDGRSVYVYTVNNEKYFETWKNYQGENEQIYYRVENPNVTITSRKYYRTQDAPVFILATIVVIIWYILFLLGKV